MAAAARALGTAGTLAFTGGILQFSAANADPFTRSLPEFQLIAGWEFRDPPGCLFPTTWRLCGIVGTAYADPQPDGARFAWTDVYPDPVVGDFNGDGAADAADAALLVAFVAQNDGSPGFDADGQADGIVQCPNFARSFSLFDTDYDGLVRLGDVAVPGDMDLNGLLTIDDVADFVQALIDLPGYRATHGGVDPLLRGDLNHDGRLDGDDIALFVELFMAI